MMMETCTLWVCVDCLCHHANGECGTCHTDEGHDRDPLSSIDWANGEHVSEGLFHDQHTCGERGGAPDTGLDCDCETQDFSWVYCGGCGSTLGGERYAMTLWYPI